MTPRFALSFMQWMLRTAPATANSWLSTYAHEERHPFHQSEENPPECCCGAPKDHQIHEVNSDAR